MEIYEVSYAGVSLWQLGLICVSMVLFLYYTTTETYRARGMLARLPAFHAWPIVGDALHLKRNPVEFYKQILEEVSLNRTQHSILKICYGPFAHIFLFSAAEAEKLLNSSDHIDKSSSYNFLHKWLGTGLLNSTGPKWKSRRKMLTPSFHFNILQDFLVKMNEHALSLKEVLSSKISGSDAAFDIFPYITLNALDIIADTAMGVKMDALHQSESDYVRAVYLVKDALAVRLRTPWLMPDFIYDSLPIGKKVNKGIDIMHKYATKIIEERRILHSGSAELDRKHKVFLDMLLDCTDEDGRPLTFDDIREEVDTFMFEGHDTVSAAAAHAVHLLGANPDAQRKCQEELDEIFETTREITMDDLRKMDYLEACIKEVLRIFPSVPFFERTLSKDAEFGGYTIPKGTDVLLNVSSLHRDPEIFPDPEKFDPERFLAHNCSKRHPYAFVPFSAGPRNCIGQRFALMELKVVLSTILRNFEITSTQLRDELDPNPGLVLQPSHGIWVKLTPRSDFHSL